MRDWKGMERAVAKLLGDWWGCSFRRTPSSGAWNTQSRKMGQGSTDFHGDIVAPPQAGFPFSVECKAYKEVEIYKALYGKSNLFEFWKQCRADARAAGKVPMLVVKENRKNALVGFSFATYKALVPDPAALPSVRVVWAVRGTQQTLVLMDLKLFTETVSAAYVKQSLEIR